MIDTVSIINDTCPIMTMNGTVLYGSTYYIGIWNDSGSNIFQDLNRDIKNTTPFVTIQMNIIYFSLLIMIENASMKLTWAEKQLLATLLY